MKTNLFLGLALLSMAPNAVSAQENSDSLYIRNSVYMLKPKSVIRKFRFHFVLKLNERYILC